MWLKKKRRGIESPHGFFGVGVPAEPLIAQRDQKSLLLESQIDLSFHLLCCHVFSSSNPSHNPVRASLNWSPILLRIQLVTNHRFHWKTRVKERYRLDKMMLKRDNGNADQLQVDHDREAPDPGDRSAPLSLTHTCKARGQIRDLCQS